ncbi:hypothetical protein ACHAWF_007873 [Thalassiosira exigua]
MPRGKRIPPPASAAPFVSEISVEMRSVPSSRGGDGSYAATSPSTGTGGYRDSVVGRPHREPFDVGVMRPGCGFDGDDDMVSDITAITRAIDEGPGGLEDVRAGGGGALTVRWRRALIPCLAFVACVIAVAIVASWVRTTGSPPTGGGGRASAGGKIVEFAVANLSNSSSATAEDKFRVRLRPDWAPLGAERFELLTAAGFWDEGRIFRIVPGFVSQFGLSSDPAVQKVWSSLGPIRDDPVIASNTRGRVSFATSGDNTRTTQVFINAAKNSHLDDQGFAPIGEVLPPGEGHGGMDVVDAFYAGYGERPSQSRIRNEGRAYLEEEFPLLSYFAGAAFVYEDVDEDEIFD